MITYSLNGDYQVPNLVLEEEMQKSFGKYGMLRQNFLKENRKGHYAQLVITGELASYLQYVDDMARLQVETVTKNLQMLSPGPNKAADPIGWTAHMNMLHAQAEEYVLHDMIFV